MLSRCVALRLTFIANQIGSLNAIQLVAWPASRSTSRVGIIRVNPIHGYRVSRSEETGEGSEPKRRKATAHLRSDALRFSDLDFAVAIQRVVRGQAEGLKRMFETCLTCF